MRRRQFLATALAGPTRVVHALDVLTFEDADTLDTTVSCLNELVASYSRAISFASPMSVYEDLLSVRRYTSTLLDRSRHSKLRPDLNMTAGWLSNLLAIATSYMGDHGAALVWCTDAERRSREAKHPDLAGWASLTRAMIAYYQGNARLSVDLACHGQKISSVGAVAHARLAAQEMRARAMLGDCDGMAVAKRRATDALALLPSGAAGTGAFSMVPSEDPPYTATSLFLVGRYKEAVITTNRVIEHAYQTNPGNGGVLPTNHARALLILGLANAGLGRLGDAVTAGRNALGCAELVWPTLVLARKLDQVLMQDFAGTGEAANYHAHYIEAASMSTTPFAAITGRHEDDR